MPKKMSLGQDDRAQGQGDASKLDQALSTAKSYP